MKAIRFAGEGSQLCSKRRVMNSDVWRPDVTGVRDRLTSTWCTLSNVYSHGKNSRNRQFTSNYHDPTLCHIPPLPQYSLYRFLYFCVCLTLIPVDHSSVSLPFRLIVSLVFLSSVKPEVN
nr:hypothetical transcript [Hymenolepis microstoma]